MTMATTTTKPSNGGRGCGGDACVEIDPWPLHHVRHRGIFCRLCSSCVLKYHPGSFCTLCFSLLDGGSPATGPPAAAAPVPTVVHCSKCSSVSHLACLPNPDLASQFVCPSCKSPEGFPYFTKGARSDEGKRRVIDLEASKVLLAAAKLAERSLRRAVAAARTEAEKKAKEAAVASKRTREMLERSFAENKRNAAAAAAAAAVTAKPAVVVAPKAVEAEEPKKKAGKVGGGSREFQKWMRCHEPVSVLKGEGKAEKGKLEAGVSGEAKGRDTGSLGKEEKG